MGMIIDVFARYAGVEGSKQSLTKGELKVLMEKELPGFLQVRGQSLGRGGSGRTVGWRAGERRLGEGQGAAEGAAGRQDHQPRSRSVALGTEVSRSRELE